MNDLIIGAADNYDWNQVKPWALSIKASGFSGKVVLIVYRVTPELIEQCEKLGIEVIRAEYDDFGNVIDHNRLGLQTQSHQLRNFHMWQYLVESAIQCRYVIVTDTRDVYFQRNPSEWLDEGFNRNHDFMLPSEGITFENEEWNAMMVQKAFGSYVWEYLMKKRTTCNSGTFVGKLEAMKELLLAMHLVTRNIGLSGIDQATLNVLGEVAFKNRTFVMSLDSAWACQCGTTLDPTKSYLWKRLYEPQPRVVKAFGELCVVTSKSVPFVMVHQWDRVPELKSYVEKKYGQSP